MRHRITQAAACLTALLALSTNVTAQVVPYTLGYSGFLSDADGPFNGLSDIEVSLYEFDTPAVDEIALWSETHRDVEVVEGTFALQLGENTVLDPTIFDDGELYLEFVVNGEGMTPRAPVHSVPYSLRSELSAEARTLTDFDPDDLRLDIDCSSDSFVQLINPDGTYECALDSVLTEAEVDGFVGDNGYQDRVDGECPEGQAIRVINEDGTAVCQAVGGTVDGDITAVFTTTGLSGGGESGDLTLSINPAEVQVRVGDECAEGSSIRRIGQDGYVECEPDDVQTQANIEAWAREVCYNELGELTTELDNVYQGMVTQSCPENSSIRVIHSNGDVDCETDDSGAGGGGDITAVVATNGIVGGGDSGDVTLELDNDYIEGRYLSTNGGTIDGSLTINGAVSLGTGNTPGTLTEDFENAIPTSFDGDWELVTNSTHTGSYSIRNRDIGDSSNSTLSLTVTLALDGTVSFFRRTSTESGYDYLNFDVDGSLQERWSGNNDWAEVSFTLSAGTHLLEWEYSKDTNTSAEEDSVYIDDLTVTNVEGGAVMLTVNGGLRVTGLKNFVTVHPTDSAREIVYVSLEGGEAGTYCRGTARLEDGFAVIDLPEHFTLVTSTRGLTAQITPLGPNSGLWVESLTDNRLVVRTTAPNRDVEFHYLVHGLRVGFENHQAIQNRATE